MANNTQPIGDNAKFKDIAKMPINIELFDFIDIRITPFLDVVDGFWTTLLYHIQ